MQVTADIVDWSWLTSVAHSSRVIEELFDAAESEERIQSCYKFNPRWIDSAMIYFFVALAMKSLLAQEDPVLRACVEKAIYPLVSENQAVDELGLSSKTEGCYYASLSPSVAASTADAFRNLNLDDFVTRLTRTSPQPILDLPQIPDEKIFLKEYFQQWQDVLDQARAKGWGILGHLG